MKYRYFIEACKLLLVATAILKIVSVLGEVAYLGKPSFLGVVTNRQMLLIAALAEVVTIVALYHYREPYPQALALAWLTTCFLIWRVALRLAEFEQCGCLGTAYGWLPMKAATVDTLMKIALGVMLVGSYGRIAMEVKGRRTSGNG
jgi:hypothetical protein